MATVPHCKGSYSKRAKGSGWQVKFPLGWSEAKKKYDEYREEFSSEAEAIAAIKDINDFLYHGGNVADVAAHRRKGSLAKGKGIAFGEFADKYVQIREEKKQVAERTIEHDRSCIKRVRPYIGDMPLGSITPKDIDEMWAAMRAGGPKNKNGKIYTGTTLEKTHTCIKAIFDKAIDYSLIERNPCQKVEKPKRDTPEKESLTPEQAQALFAFIVSEPLTAHSLGVLLALGCGIRLSEMLALTWKDYRDGGISVDKSQRKEKQDAKETKNGEKRFVPCIPPMIEVMEMWKAQQQVWYKEQGLRWSEGVPIVNSSVGNHMLQRSYTRWFEKERLRYPIPDHFTMHSLRHTFVTLMGGSAGVDTRTIREMSGHKTDQAFSVYTHTNTEMLQHAVELYGAIIAPNPEMQHCMNCKHWTASPHDATKGSCWKKQRGSKVAVTSGTGECDIDSFAMRSVR